MGRMHAVEQQICDDWVQRPDEAALRQANVNPETGLATDFLNLFNEYIMLAELVADGSMDHDVLEDWLPIDYETHFARSGFAGAEVVLAAYRSLDCSARHAFEQAVGQLIDLILVHQDTDPPPAELIGQIQHQRDRVAALISEPAETVSAEAEDAQAAIDALFD